MQGDEKRCAPRRARRQPHDPAGRCSPARNAAIQAQPCDPGWFGEVEQLTPDLTGAHALRHPPDLSGRLAVMLGG